MSLLRRAVLGAIALFAAVMLAAAPVSAAPSEQDASWLAAAHQSNLTEIAAGTAAQERATTEAVQEAGAKLVEDHTALDAELTALAEELGVDLPTAPSAMQQATLDAVAAHEGEAFDAAWIASQIDGHRMSLAAGQEQVQNGSEPAVVALAEKAGPVIQGHLDHLLQLADEVPGAVPSGLGGPAVPTLLGASLVGVGVLVLAASLIIVRRGRVHA